MRYTDSLDRRGVCPPGAGVHSLYMHSDQILQPKLRMPILQGRTRRYRKTCNHKVSDAGCSGRKGPASASTVTWPMYQKYDNGLPLYRQERDWKQYVAQISRTTLANWIIYCSQNYFQPMYDQFHHELLKRSFAMADETRVQVLNEEGRRAQTQSFMWLFPDQERQPRKGVPGRL